MSNETVKSIQSATNRGITHLSIRSLLQNILQIISSLILANYLSPSDYGIFGIITGWTGALIFLTDLGLGQTFMLQKEELSEKQLADYLGIRLLLAIIVSIAYIVVFPFIKIYYHLDQQYTHILIFYFISLFLDIIMSYPKVIFNKKLEFEKIAKVDFYSTLVLYGIQIGLAILGFGFWSFFIANIIRWCLGIYLGFKMLGHGLPKPKINLIMLKENFKMGASFQLISIIPVSKSILLPLLMAYALDINEIGIIFWLVNMVSIPKILYYNYNHVFFATLSKVSNQMNKVKELADHTMSLGVVGLSFIFGLGSYLGPFLIQLLFNQKFFSAANYIQLASLAIGLSTLEFLHHAVLSATGKPAQVTKVQIFSLIFDAILTYFFCLKFGIFGYFYGQIIIYSLSSIYIHLYTKKYLGKLFYTRIIYSFLISFGLNLISVGTPTFLGLSTRFIIYVLGFILILFIFDQNLYRSIVFKLKSWLP